MGKFEEFIEDENVIEEVNEKILIDLQEENIELISMNNKLKVIIITLSVLLVISLSPIIFSIVNKCI